MRAALPVLVSLASLTLAFSADVPTTRHYDGLDGASRYSNGYVVGWDSPKYSLMTVYGPDTRPLYSIPIRQEAHSRCLAFTIDSDGIGVCAFEVLKPWTGGLNLLGPSGTVKLKIDTGTYLPQHVVFAPDHSLWTVGFMAGNNGSLDGFNVFRHYSREGKELGQAVPWSSIAGDHNAYTALQSIVGTVWLHASSDRLGFYALFGEGQKTWIEVSYTGVILGKYDLGRCADVCYSPRTMTPGNAVYAQIYRESEPAGWAVLDRVKSVWLPLTGYPGGRIIGSDENDSVVVSKKDETGSRIQFVAPVSLRTKIVPIESAAR